MGEWLGRGATAPRQRRLRRRLPSGAAKRRTAGFPPKPGASRVRLAVRSSEPAAARLRANLEARIKQILMVGVNSALLTLKLLNSFPVTTLHTPDMAEIDASPLHARVRRRPNDDEFCPAPSRAWTFASSRRSKREPDNAAMPHRGEIFFAYLVASTQDHCSHFRRRVIGECRVHLRHCLSLI